MAADSKEITAFTVPGKGLFQWNVMPFGLSNAPATFQRLVDKLIDPEMEPNVFAYLDDLIIVTETFEQHLEFLEKVLLKVSEAGLVVTGESANFVADASGI